MSIRSAAGKLRLTGASALVSLAVLSAAASYADDDARSHAPQPALGAWQIEHPIDANTLDTMRGGMLTEHGLNVSVGIQREVFINGQLVSTTTLTLSDLTRLAGGGAAKVELGGDPSVLVQNGAGNVVLTPLADSPAIATVIQNTLDNQIIRGVTQINANVSSMELLRGMQITNNAVEMLGRSR
jgi:hypothetical protein